MHPSIARGALSAWSKAGELVVDPFCGSGTVLVEAMGLGPARDRRRRQPAGHRHRARAHDRAGRARGASGCASEAARIAEESGENARKRRRPESPPWAKKEFERFHPHVALELLGLRALVMDTPEDDVGHALRLCLSSILVKLMKAGPEAPRDGAEKRIGRGMPSRLFTDRADELARGLAALERRVPAGTPAPEIRLGDARDLRVHRRRRRSRWWCRRRRTPAPTTTPPSTTCASPGWSCRAGRFATRRSARAPRGPGRRSALPGATASAAGSARSRACCAPGGHAMLVVGDGVVGGEAEDAPDAVASAVAPAGPGADRARVAGAPGDRQPPAGDLRGRARGASTCCCCARRGSRVAPDGSAPHFSVGKSSRSASSWPTSRSMIAVTAVSRRSMRASRLTGTRAVSRGFVGAPGVE